jgi:endonuclease/exonuclease/phosphatase family metal-dependent hydrolase
MWCMMTNRTLAGSLVAVVAAGLISAPAAAAPPGDTATTTTVTTTSAVPADRRAALLGDGWRSSEDRSWTVAGDGDGLHVMVADARQGYAWRTVATLSEPGLEPDSWIGNACVTASARRAVVVYAPRSFTNEEALFDRGAFAAVVDLDTGAVRKLRDRVSLAYFNPGCGVGERALLTQAGDQDLGRTRVLELDAVAGTVSGRIEVPGQLTSAVPTADGVVAADGATVVRVEKSGKRRMLARTSSVPFRLAADADGGLVYLQQEGGDRASARRLGRGASAPETLATGSLTGLDVTAGRGGRVFVTGAGKRAAVGGAASVSLVDVPAGSRMSTRGELALTEVRRAGAQDPRSPTGDPAAPRTLRVKATAAATGGRVQFAAVAPEGGPGAGRALSPAVPDDPADFAERYCSVPRNDPRNQAMQPKPRQVEWAVNQAIRHSLTVTRPANWKNLGMPQYTPQQYFPPVPLAGGGYIPAQVMLGVAAQESNLWQAARYAVPGVTANPLIGNYYGLDLSNGTELDDWTIRWQKADCGYGVTQVTDGMRLAGRQKEGEEPLPYDKQRAVALDFAANIAAGVQILQKKWNETRAAGLIVNDGTAAKLENWYFAVWAYNSGFYPQSTAAANNGAWGVGWANNPANPKYPANRGAFLENDNFGDDYFDATHPQDWPYPEKVMGWAGHPVEVLESPDTMVVGYRAAFWNGGAAQGPINRRNVIPPHRQFCDASNNCEWGAQHLPDDPEVAGEPAGPCNHRNGAGRIDLKCWYHQSTTWKPDCSLTCGNEVLRFDPGYAYQEDGTAYPPRCDLSGLPAGARVIDNVPDNVASVRPNCARAWVNAGTFDLSYRADATGAYPGKIDTHQLGMGHGGHFWMANSRSSAANGEQLQVIGRWRFHQTHAGLGTLMAHLPQLNNGTPQAKYEVKTAYGTRIAVIDQKGNGNRWVKLGTYRFNGTPEVTLTNLSSNGDGSQRVAFDSMAFVPVDDARLLKVLHWNLAGAARNNGDYYVVDRLLREIRERRPDIVTLNEACLAQYDHLRLQLISEGYEMPGHFYLKNEINPTCFNAADGRLQEGNAVLVRGDVTKEQDYAFMNGGNELVEGRSGSGWRGVACVDARFSGTDRDVKACSFHLTSDYPADPQAGVQARELARVFGPEARQKPLILAGDTNIHTPPRDPNLGALYSEPIGTGDFNEVEQERACVQEPTCEVSQGGGATHSENRYDYVFAARQHLHTPVGRSVVVADRGLCGSEQQVCSDHHMVYAEVQLPRG